MADKHRSANLTEPTLQWLVAAYSKHCAKSLTFIVILIHKNYVDYYNEHFFGWGLPQTHKS